MPIETAQVDPAHAALFKPIEFESSNYEPPSELTEDTLKSLAVYYKNNPGSFLKPQIHPQREESQYYLDESNKTFPLVVDLIKHIPNSFTFNKMYKTYKDASNIESVVGVDVFFLFIAIVKDIFTCTVNQEDTYTFSQKDGTIFHKKRNGSVNMIAQEKINDSSPRDSLILTCKISNKLEPNNNLLQRIMILKKKLPPSMENMKGYNKVHAQQWESIEEFKKIECIKGNLLKIQCLLKILLINEN